MIASLLIRGLIRPAPGAPETTAVAIGGGRVLALGNDAEQLETPDTTVIDTGAGCLLPAFRDGHAHPLWGGVELGQAPVAGASTVEGILAAVRAHAAAHPEQEWVLGSSYLQHLLPGGIGTAEALDSAVPDRPVALTSDNHHSMWVNSAALAAAGITADTRDPELGQIVRHPDGRPVGTLLEWGAMELVERCLPEVTPAERTAGLLRGATHLASLGLAFAQDAAVSAEDVGVYRSAVLEGLLPIRAALALRAEPGRWRDLLADWVALRAQTERLLAAAGCADRLALRTVKFFADGVIESGTGAMLEPYQDAPHSCGLPNWVPAELSEAVAGCDAAGFSVHIHAIGDAGVRMALDAVEFAQAQNGHRDRRPVVAHTQVVHPDDLPRFEALGVVANFEPLWAQLDPTMIDQTLPRIGATRGEQQYPIAGLLRRGAGVTFGSDWPVTSASPLAGIAVAVTRQTPDGQPTGGWTPDQRIPLPAALAAYTTGVSHQTYAAAGTGRLTVGAPADLVLLAEDPYGLPPGDLRDLPVLGTWLGGVRTY